MTGLDLDVDSIVEIAVVVTDSELFPLDDGLRIVIKPTAQAVEQMDPYVRDMHTATGLINMWDDGVSLADAEAAVMAYIERFVPEPRRAPLGGNSVGTDRSFIARDMPTLDAHLHYRIIDVSSIKELAKRWYPRTYFAAPEKTGNHTALGDIYDSIDELRYYRAVLFPDGEGPSTEESQEIARQIESDLTRSRAQQAAKDER
ncbi:Oligoribonuclease [Trueperella bialowiezensis]|uniref:Oligoribonuclease n=2 Tax=Trueperella bialowiezensis TaxID=312285 RepID=A0A448PCV6_9ACTO|nr:Oligoribonuclease [Trueperella bialowiezensis]